METLIKLGFFILLVVALAIFRFISVRRQNNKLNSQRYERIKPLYELLDSGSEPSQEELKPYADHWVSRELLFELLRDYGKLKLFPAELNNFISAAESNLVNWLMYPTELGSEPDELLHEQTVELEFGEIYRYEVFKFRKNESKVIRPDEWAWGVVGPYYMESQPYDFPQATFSRFRKISLNSPEEEALWVHENILKA